MRFLAIFVISAFTITANAQSDDKDEVMQVINNVFEAMRTSDSTLLKNCFIKSPNTSTIFRSPEGVTKFVIGDFQRFINGVGSKKDKIWDEPIWNEKVEIDDDLAAVWVDYAFYLGDQFLHCGVDAFHLVRQEGIWKIFNLVDTRRKTGCKIPDDIKK